MSDNISTAIFKVNRMPIFHCNRLVYTINRMKYGDRLRLARKFADLSQLELAEKAGVTQPTISQLENSETDMGSVHTVRLARACGVSPDWLDDEIGEMLPDIYYTADKKLIAICKAMEDRAEYVKDAAVAAVLTTRELAERASSAGGNSGTHG